MSLGFRTFWVFKLLLNFKKLDTLCEYFNIWVWKVNSAQLQRIYMSKLIDIQKGYIEIVKKYFNHFYTESKKRGASPSLIARDLLSNPYFSRLINENIEETFLGEIEDYWEKNYLDLISEIKKLTGLKLYFSGDISPSEFGVVNRMGLYADTIILPDPVLRASMISKIVQPHLKYFYLIKHSIKVLDYENLVLANLPQPIVVFFPSTKILNDPNIRNKIQPIVFNKTVEFLNSNLSIQKSSFQEWTEYFSGLNSIDDFEKITINPEAFLFDSDIKQKDFKIQIEQLIKKNSQEVSDEVNQEYSGLKVVPFSIMGRMGQSYWHIVKSELLDSYPFQDAYVSWHYLKWQMQHQKDVNQKKETIIPSSLLEDNFSFLSKVPLDILIQLRRDGVLQDLRNTISKEINTNLSDDLQQKNAKQIQYNLKNELLKHQLEIKELEKDFKKRFKLQVSSLVGSVGLGILGIFSNPLFTIPAAILGGSTMWNMAEKFDQKETEKEKFGKSFWGFYSEEK